MKSGWRDNPSSDSSFTVVYGNPELVTASAKSVESAKYFECKAYNWQRNSLDNFPVSSNQDNLSW